jgi:hypothetical protein
VSIKIFCKVSSSRPTNRKNIIKKTKKSMKSILSGAVAAIAIVACLSLNVQAGSINPAHTIAVSDTGKMAMGKMKMGKMKMSKMKKDSMKMAKKMDKMKMSKDTTKKM